MTEGQLGSKPLIYVLALPRDFCQS